MPHVVDPPVLIVVHPALPATSTGVSLPDVVALPSWPKLLRPQHQAVVSVRVSQEVWPPALTATAAEATVRTTAPGTAVVGGVVPRTT